MGATFWFFLASSRDRRRRCQDSHGSRGDDGGHDCALRAGVPPTGRLPLVCARHLRQLHAPDPGPARGCAREAARARAESPVGTDGPPAGPLGPAAPQALPGPDGLGRWPWPVSFRQEHDWGRGSVDGSSAPGPHESQDQIRENPAAVGFRLGADGEAAVPGQGHPALTAGAQRRHQGVPAASENLQSRRGRQWEEVPGENAQRAVGEPRAAGAHEVSGVRSQGVLRRGRAAEGVRSRRTSGPVLRVCPPAGEVKRKTGRSWEAALFFAVCLGCILGPGN